MPRFVILEHDQPFLHWDLMLEFGGVLRSWRLLERPKLDAKVAAQPLGDHRALYLDYEGPVSGGRGTVTRWDAGTFDLIDEAADHLAVHLAGRALRGPAILQRDSAGTWSFLLDAREKAPG